MSTLYGSCEKAIFVPNAEHAVSKRATTLSRASRIIIIRRLQDSNRFLFRFIFDRFFNAIQPFGADKQLVVIYNDQNSGADETVIVSYWKVEPTVKSAKRPRVSGRTRCTRIWPVKEWWSYKSRLRSRNDNEPNKTITNQTTQTWCRERQLEGKPSEKQAKIASSRTEVTK